MLSAKEKRFVRFWEEQRTGGKWNYILVNTIGWGIIAFFLPVAIFYILGMLQFFKLLQAPVWMLVVFPLLISFAGSIHFWHRNEEKWKELSSK